MKRSRKFPVPLFFVLIGLLPGCVTAPPRTGVQPPGAPPEVPGLHHKVERGQTLWRISRIYGVDLQDLLEANNIADSGKISTGQMLRIPGGRTVRLSKPQAEDEDFVWPLRGRLLSGFGETAGNGPARGVSIAPSQRDIVVASRSGKVVFYNEDFLDLGRTLIIEHAGGFWTVYGRNSEVYVKIGDEVSQGTLIARTGRAGRDAENYLYFEIRKGHIPQNPSFYLSR